MLCCDNNVFSGLKFFDADDFHPQKNIAKMAAGEPLTDEDRYLTIFMIVSDKSIIQVALAQNIGVFVTRPS